MEMAETRHDAGILWLLAREEVGRICSRNGQLESALISFDGSRIECWIADRGSVIHLDITHGCVF